MAQIKIYGIKENLNPIKQELSGDEIMLDYKVEV